MTSVRIAAACSGLWLFLLPDLLVAQWDVSAYLGKSFTHAADVRLTQPPQTALTFEKVRFDDQSFTPPLYYGFRGGYAFTPSFGAEGEFIHAKVFGDVSTGAQVRGRLAGTEQTGILPLAVLVEQYNISHGLNLVLGNAVLRQEITSRLTVVLRTGAGFALPHLELRAGNEEVSEYQMGGLAIHLAGGVQVKLHSQWYASGEYKLTRTRSRFEPSSLIVENLFLTHYVVTGIGFRF